MLKSTLALKKSDDLFEKSSMSFGDHLEELRQALIKASYWLIAGLVIGVPSATTVVSYFQKPLEAALDDFYREKSIHQMETDTGKSVDASLKNWMTKEHKQAELIFIDRLALRAMLQGDEATAAIPTASDPSASPASDAQSSDAAPADGPAVTPSPEPTVQPVVKPAVKPAGGSEALGLAPAPLGAAPIPQDLTPVWTFKPIESQAETFQMQEGMVIWFKAALVVAFIVASPGIFYHVWGFVAAGLYPHERRYVYFFLPASVGLFWVGALFAFFVVFRMVISFLLNFNSMMGVGTTPRLNDYMSFALMLPIGFGISFQLPLVMLIVERLGLVTVKQYLAQWRMAVFIIAFGSMILTPGGEMTSMIAMTVPLIFLYFLGIGLCQYLPRANMLGGPALDPK